MISGESRPLKILTVADVPADPNSGAAGTVYWTNVALRSLGHEVDEVWQDDLPHRIRHGNLHALWEQPRGYRDAVSAKLARRDYDVIQMSQPQAFLAAEWLKKRRFPGIVVNRSHGLELLSNAVLSKWHRRLGVPEGPRSRALLRHVMRVLLERQWPRVAAASDGVILPTHDDRDYLLTRVQMGADRARVIHHGVPDAFLSDPAPRLEGVRLRRLLHIGQFAFFKGPHILAGAMNRVLLEHPDARLTWICASAHHGEASQLLSAAARERTTFLPWQSQASLRALYDEHGVFVYPSLYEGAGKASLEAMARGLCVVASDTGGMRDYITHGQSGCLTPVGDVDTLAAAMASLLSDPPSVARLGAAARIAASAYSWERCATQAVSFYDELLRLRHGSSRAPREVAEGPAALSGIDAT